MYESATEMQNITIPDECGLALVLHWSLGVDNQSAGGSLDDTNVECTVLTYPLWSQTRPALLPPSRRCSNSPAPFLLQEP